MLETKIYENFVFSYRAKKIFSSILDLQLMVYVLMWYFNILARVLTVNKK